MMTAEEAAERFRRLGASHVECNGGVFPVGNLAMLKHTDYTELAPGILEETIGHVEVSAFGGIRHYRYFAMARCAWRDECRQLVRLGTLCRAHGGIATRERSQNNDSRRL